jgi:hypothetical protein
MQIVVLWRASGRSRWVAAAPLVVMVPIYVLAFVGALQGGDNNLWPLLLILPSPVALLYVVIVGSFMWAAAKKSPSVT